METVLRRINLEFTDNPEMPIVVMVYGKNQKLFDETKLEDLPNVVARNFNYAMLHQERNKLVLFHTAHYARKKYEKHLADGDLVSLISLSDINVNTAHIGALHSIVNTLTRILKLYVYEHFDLLPEDFDVNVHPQIIDEFLKKHTALIAAATNRGKAYNKAKIQADEEVEPALKQRGTGMEFRLWFNHIPALEKESVKSITMDTTLFNVEGSKKNIANFNREVARILNMDFPMEALENDDYMADMNTIKQITIHNDPNIVAKWIAQIHQAIYDNGLIMVHDVKVDVYR